MKWKGILAIGLALVVLGIFVIVVGWEEVLGAAARADLVIYGGAFVAMLWCLFHRSMVWHKLLEQVDTRRPYWLVSAVFLTAMFAKYVTPYGQVASGVGMAAVVSRYYESKYEESLAAIVSADFLNYLPYYTFGGLGLLYLISMEAPLVDPREYAVPLVILVGVVGLFIVTVWTQRAFVSNGIVRGAAVIERAISRISERHADMVRPENIERRLEGFYVTLDLVSRDRPTLLAALGFAHLAWLGLAGALFFSALAVGVRLPIGLVLLAVALSKFGFLMPSPGGVGGVEIALATALFLITPMGFAVSTAVAILYRFSTYWFTVLIGGIASVGLTMSDPTPP